jgi:hypothetical protein
VAAWGNHGEFLDRGLQVLKLLEGLPIHVLGKTLKGHPKHPLYLPAYCLPEKLEV